MSNQETIRFYSWRLDEAKEVRAIFCDISKAFDRVWHRDLLFKLQSVGVSGLLFQWFTDYLPLSLLNGSCSLHVNRSQAGFIQTLFIFVCIHIYSNI